MGERGLWAVGVIRLGVGGGLSGLREGCGGFRVDSNSPERVGEGSKGPRGVFGLGVGGGPLGAERGLWGVGFVCFPSQGRL